MQISTAFEMAGFAVSPRKAPDQIAEATLMKDVEVVGKFWLPERPNRKVSGTLRYTPGRDTSIVTNGSFFGAKYSNAQRKSAVVHGKLMGGAPCSLLDAWIHEGGNLTDRSIGDSLWLDISGQMLIVGAHIRSLDELKLSSLTVQFSHVDEWIGSPFSVKRERDNRDASTVEYHQQDLVLPFRVGGNRVDVQLACSRSVPIRIAPNSVSWGYSYQLRFMPKRPIVASVLLDSAASLRRLFTFLIGSSVYTLKLSGKRARTRTQDNVELYPTVTVPNSVRIDKRYFHTPFEKIKENLPAISASWSDNADQLDVVTRGIQELSTIDGIAPQGLFLAVTQLLEHFDGVLHPNNSNIIAPAVWNEFLNWLKKHRTKGELVERISNAKLAADDSVSILCQRISGVNRISFRSRMLRLFLDIPFHTLFRILRNPPADHVAHVRNLLKRVQHTRDYLTHLGGRRPKDLFSMEELQEVTTVCWSVLIYWTAKALRMPEKLCSEFASNARLALFLVSGSKEL